MKTNILELKAHLKMVFNEMLSTPEFKRHAEEAGKSMKDSVIKKMKDSGYSYKQSGTLLRVAKGDIPVLQVNKTGSKATIGYGDIDEWNFETKRQPQRPTFKINGMNVQIGLRPEPSLPAWIIMEFGRRGTENVGTDNIPKEFTVPYKSRDANKKFLFGPSETMHFNKKVFFMSHMQKEEGVPRNHPGIKAGRFFRDGLKDSQKSVQENLGNGLEESLKSLAKKYGGRVENL